MKNLFLALFLTLTTLMSWAQGTITGTVIDDITKETIIGATVILKENGKGTITDFDGNYTLMNVPAGTYTLEIQYVSYANFLKEGVVVSDGGTVRVDTRMKEAVTSLGAVTIKAVRKSNTENALVMEQKKSDVVISGVSKEELKKSVASTAAEGMKKVTGVSIQGGKYAAVRGMDGRYIATAINGVSIPNTDPDKNSAQLDLVPASVLDNIVITKTFAPDQSGTTTGGGINLKTKSFPDKQFFNFSSSVGINSVSWGRDDFMTYDGGKTDWLGYDDGTRAPHAYLLDTAFNGFFTKGNSLKARKDDSIATIIDETAKSVSRQMTPSTKRTPINRSISLSYGNSHKLGESERKFGYSFSTNYKNSTTYYEEGQFNVYESPGVGGDALIENLIATDQRSAETPTVGALAGLSFEFADDNVISYVGLYNHNAEKYARQMYGDFPGVISNTNALYNTNVLSFKEREIFNHQLFGKHQLHFLDSTVLGGLEIDWAFNRFTFQQDEPDLRFFSYDYDRQDSLYYISKAEYVMPTHFYRNLKDEQNQFKLDLKLPFHKKRENDYIKIGGLTTKKDRVFYERTYIVDNRSTSLFTETDGDVDAYFADTSMGVIGTDDRGRNVIGNYLSDDSDPKNNFWGATNLTAMYGMSAYTLSDRFKVIFGARFESINYQIQRDIDDTLSVDRTENNILPSVNTIFNMKKDGSMKIRASVSQTVARPSLRELSPFTSRQFIGGPFIVGNQDLVNTKITNLDLRYEWYFKAGEMISVSVYNKQFENPIIRRVLATSNTEITWENVPTASLLGSEFEFKKNLGFIAPFMKNMKVGGNVTVVQSSIVEADSVGADERAFPAQSALLYNADLAYKNDSIGFMTALSLNYNSDRIFGIGESVNMDVMELGIMNLNFVVNKDLGEHFSAKFSVKNILNAKRERYLDYKDQIYILQSNRIGRNYSIGISYKL